MRDRILQHLRSFRREEGLSLIEVVIILVILGITIIPLSRLSIGNLRIGGQYSMMTRAVYYAQERMEQIIADYAAVDGGRGYDWVRANWAGDSDNPESGFSRSVSISSENTLNGVTYVTVQVVISNTEIENVVLSTWIVDNS